MNHPSDTADRAFADLLSRVQADPSVLGLVLLGSRAFEGMATAHSDYDVLVIRDESEQGRRWQDGGSPGLDLPVVPLSKMGAELRNHEFADTIDVDSGRYIYTQAGVLVDRLGGQITAIVREIARFPASSRERLPTMLDAYLNLLYRSLKSWRDGRPMAAHLDAARSVDLALWVIFAMHDRLRPPNKYLDWELQRRPLDDTTWDAAHLLARVQRILVDGDAETQRSLFRDIESTARAAGLGDTVDSWGDDVKLFHCARPA